MFAVFVHLNRFQVLASGELFTLLLLYLTHTKIFANSRIEFKVLFILNWFQQVISFTATWIGVQLNRCDEAMTS